MFDAAPVSNKERLSHAANETTRNMPEPERSAGEVHPQTGQQLEDAQGAGGCSRKGQQDSRLRTGERDVPSDSKESGGSTHGEAGKSNAGNDAGTTKALPDRGADEEAGVAGKRAAQPTEEYRLENHTEAELKERQARIEAVAKEKAKLEAELEKQEKAVLSMRKSSGAASGRPRPAT